MKDFDFDSYRKKLTEIEELVLEYLSEIGFLKKIRLMRVVVKNKEKIDRIVNGAGYESCEAQMLLEVLKEINERLFKLAKEYFSILAEIKKASEEKYKELTVDLKKTYRRYLLDII